MSMTEQIYVRDARQGVSQAGGRRARQRAFLFSRWQMAWLLARADRDAAEGRVDWRRSGQDLRCRQRRRRWSVGTGRHDRVCLVRSLSCTGVRRFTILLLKVDEPRGERFFRHPSFLPSERRSSSRSAWLIYSYDDAEIGVLSLDTGKKKILVQGGTSPHYSPSGHLIYARAGRLLAVPFDPDKLEVTGQPFPWPTDSS